MNDELPSGSVLPALLVTLFGLALLGLGVVLALPFLMRAKQPSNRDRCSSNLRQIALAAMCYAGDKRFFPHVGGLRQHDGDWTTQDALRVYEALFRFGYLDQTQVAVCPTSFDVPAPATPGTAWTFPGVPLTDSGWTPLDPRRPLSTQDSLASSRWVSYGWTRRPLNNNATGNTLLGADRALLTTSSPAPLPGAQGNHSDGWNVARADGSMTFLGVGDLSSPFSTLGAISGPGAGHLAMEWAGANPAGKAPQ